MSGWIPENMLYQCIFYPPGGNEFGVWVPKLKIKSQATADRIAWRVWKPALISYSGHYTPQIIIQLMYMYDQNLT